METTRDLADEARQPLTAATNGLENLVYTIDVRIGSSGQAFNLTLDTTYRWPLIFQHGFALGNLTCADGASATRNLFDPRQSTLFQGTRYYWDWFFPNIPYVAAGCRPDSSLSNAFVSYDVKDTFSFNSFSVKNVSFLLSNGTDSPLNPRWQSDGIFPLGLEDGSAVSSLFKALGGAKEISLWLNGLYVGTKWVGTDRGSAQISTASPFLQMPSWVLYWALKPFGAEYDDQLHLYTVDCGKVDVFPAIRLVIGLGFSIDYTVPAKDFVIQLSIEAGPKCALLLAEGDLVIGTQFLPKRCVHLDYTNETISFADPIA